MTESVTEDLITLDGIKEAANVLHKSPYFRRTELLKNCESLSPRFKALGAKGVHIKLESGQVGGSFKIRGVINVLSSLPTSNKRLVTMSAGNFGRTFAFITKQLGFDATVIMPETVPKDRIATIESLGAKVELAPSIELPKRVAQKQEEGMLFVHPFDDKKLIEGYGSGGLEILEDLPDVDIVIIGVGGGGWISGVAAAMILSGSKAKIIGVEPTGAPSMFLSLQKGEAVTLEKVNTFVSGLAPPYAGKIPFQLVKKFVNEIVLVEDDEVRDAMRLLFTEQKIVVEPSGAACVAALLNGKIKDVIGKNVVCLVSGGNVSIEDMHQVFLANKK